MLRYHEKNVFVGLLNYNQSRKEDEVTLKKDEIYIKDMDLSVRTKNCLIDNKIYTLKDLKKLSDKDLLRIRNFGNKCLSELQYVLKIQTNKHMKNQKQQSEAIICYLIAGNKITSIQATQRQFGYCTKLPQRIAEIIEMGFSIKKERVNKLSIFGQQLLICRV